MAKFIILVCALLVIAVSEAKDVRFKDCGSELGKITVLDVSPCNESPCIFKRGTNETLKVTFHLNQEVETATAAVFGIFGAVKVPFPLPHPDVCRAGGLTCPLHGGKDYVYSITLPIKSLYPEVSVVVEFKLLDQNKEKIICFEIPVKIQ